MIKQRPKKENATLHCTFKKNFTIHIIKKINIVLIKLE